MFKRIFRIALAGLAMGFLAGCGGGSGGSQLSPVSTSAKISMAVTTSSTGASTTHIGYGDPVSISAVVTDKNGKAAPWVIVTFAVDDTTAATLSQTKVMTDESGKATVRVSGNKISTDTAIVVSASASITSTSTTGASATSTASGSVNLSVGQTTSGTVQGTPALLQYVSATPTRLVMKGGSVGSGTLSETSVVSFKVLDSFGAIMTGAQVTFDLTSYNGGIQLSYLDSDGKTVIANTKVPVTVTSDSGGVAKVTVHSGTLPESFLVFGTLPGSATPTQRFYSNDQLVISSYLPDQTHFTLLWDAGASCGKGTGTLTYPCSLNVYVGDYLGHPAPDGTAVTFIGSQGSVIVADTIVAASAVCLTKSGQCLAKIIAGDDWTRNEVVAYAIGQNAPSGAVVVHNYTGDNWAGATTITAVDTASSGQYIRNSIKW